MRWLRWPAALVCVLAHSDSMSPPPGTDYVISTQRGKKSYETSDAAAVRNQAMGLACGFATGGCRGLL